MAQCVLYKIQWTFSLCHDEAFRVSMILHGIPCTTSSVRVAVSNRMFDRSVSSEIRCILSTETAVGRTVFFCIHRLFLSRRMLGPSHLLRFSIIL